MASLDNSFGAMQVGLLVAAVLEGVLTLQTYVYYNGFPNDPIAIRILVGVVFVLDLVHFIFASAMQYLYVISHFGDTLYLTKANWGFDMAVFLTSVIAFLIQMFFVWRTWTLTKSPIIAIFIGVFASLSLGCGLACGALTFTLVDFEKFLRFKWLVTLWLSSAAGCDVLVAFSLSWTLWHSRTGFNATDNVLNRLILWTLNTGLLTSVIAIADAIAFATRPDLVHFAFNMCLGKLYANMFVATLNQRLASRSQTSTSHMHSGIEWTNEHAANTNATTTTSSKFGGRFNPSRSTVSTNGNKLDVHITTTRIHREDSIQDALPLRSLGRGPSLTDVEDQKVDLSDGEQSVDQQKRDLGY